MENKLIKFDVVELKNRIRDLKQNKQTFEEMITKKFESLEFLDDKGKKIKFEEKKESKKNDNRI